MGLKEILAAKKAAALASETPEPAAPATTAVVATQEPPKEAKVLALDLPVEAPAPATSSKPLSFAEKMALKKAQAASAGPVAPVIPEVKEPVINPDMLPDDPTEAAAYIGIKRTIEGLVALMGDELKSGMSQLKKALKENPAACELMLDEDLGKMVVALRRMTGEQLAAATKPPKKIGKTPKAKELVLTKEQIEAAMAEL